MLFRGVMDSDTLGFLSCRYTDMVNELATLGDDPNTLNEFGEAPLCVAAYKAQGMVVEELLQKENIRVITVIDEKDI